MDTHDTSPADVVERIVEATNAHDLDVLVECFAPGYVNQTPVHPSRGFVGREQVRRNWAQLFAAMPDLGCDVLAGGGLLRRHSHAPKRSACAAAFFADFTIRSPTLAGEMEVVTSARYRRRTSAP